MVTSTVCQRFQGPSVASSVLTKGGLELAEHGRLCADHDRLTSCLHLACAALRDGRPAESNQFFTRFRELVEHHMRSEEAILFPKLATMGEPVHWELLDVLVSEHDALRPRIAAVQASLDNGTASVAEIEELLRALTSHETKEEMYLYPILFRLAEPDGVKRLYSKHCTNAVCA